MVDWTGVFRPDGVDGILTRRFAGYNWVFCGTTDGLINEDVIIVLGEAVLG